VEADSRNNSEAIDRSMSQRPSITFIDVCLDIFSLTLAFQCRFAMISRVHSVGEPEPWLE
jgi:hypothetical protein